MGVGEAILLMKRVTTVEGRASGSFGLVGDTPSGINKSQFDGGNETVEDSGTVHGENISNGISQQTGWEKVWRMGWGVASSNSHKPSAGEWRCRPPIALIGHDGWERGLGRAIGPSTLQHPYPIHDQEWLRFAGLDKIV